MSPREKECLGKQARRSNDRCCQTLQRGRQTCEQLQHQRWKQTSLQPYLRKWAPQHAAVAQAWATSHVLEVGASFEACGSQRMLPPLPGPQQTPAQVPPAMESTQRSCWKENHTEHQEAIPVGCYHWCTAGDQRYMCSAQLRDHSTHDAQTNTRGVWSRASVKRVCPEDRQTLL